MIVDVNDLLYVYEKEVSVNTKNKRGVYNFDKNKMENIYDIKRIIESGNYSVYKYNIFFISSPKYRIVMSLNMKDKIINHYACRYILIPKLEGYLDIRNCATRSNMGYDYAINLLKKYIEINKKYGKFYILRIDISKYFYSIDHDVLKDLLKDKLNHYEYNIISSIIDSTNSNYVNDKISILKEYLTTRDINRIEEIQKLPLYNFNKGLPIGNMTSQFLSIFYLYKLDYYIVNFLKLKHFVRYMDDYAIISSDRECLKLVLNKITYILKNDYKLNINYNKTMILDNYHGFEYLGYVFSVRNNKTIIKRKKSNKKMTVRRIKRCKYLYDNGYISFGSYFNSMNNYYKLYNRNPKT